MNLKIVSLPWFAALLACGVVHAAPSLNTTSGCQQRLQIRVISSSSTTPVEPSTCISTARDPDATYPAVKSTPAASDGVSQTKGAKPRRPRPRPPLPEDNTAVRECVAKASSILRVPSTVLYLLLDVEAGPLGGSVLNTNGTRDLGPMQVNSSWLPKFMRMGVSETELTNDLCTNIMAGAWIYANERRSADTTAMAIARYHSPTAEHQNRYLGLINKAIQKRLEAKTDEAEVQTPACSAKSRTCLLVGE